MSTTTWKPLANRNTFWCSVFVEELARGGVTQACISPGSRSTPLTLALVAHPGIEIFTLLDERGAAFFALGLAKASGRPVVLVCTSGTAAANYLPAVVEAHLSAVPLILLTADRPPLLRETGDGQAIDQLKLFGDAVRWFFEVGEPVIGDEDLRRLRQLAGQAMAAAQGHPAGPVQLNFPFRKPLEAQLVPGDIPPEFEAAARPAGELPSGAYARACSAPPAAAPEVVAEIAGRIAAAPRGLLLCGPLTGCMDSQQASAWAEAVFALSRQSGYPIVGEPPAGVYDGTQSGDQPGAALIPHADLLLQAPAFREKLAPQLVLRFGGMPTAKGVEVLLNEHPDCPVVMVNPEGVWLNPTHHPIQLVRAGATLFCQQLAQTLSDQGAPGPDHTRWREAFREGAEVVGDTLSALFEAPPPQGLAGEWFEGRVFSELAPLLPEGALQFTASSMPVRDLAAFTPLTGKRVRHLVNRGANGIDGTLSSAMGAAAAIRREGGVAVLVTGDIAFHHDANALLAARQYNLPLTIVLINNDGGGIFGMLPIAEYGAVYEQHFGTPHGIEFAPLCAAYGVPHHRPGNWEAFREQVRLGLASGAPQVIEIRTERKENRTRQRLLREAVAASLARAFPPERLL